MHARSWNLSVIVLLAMILTSLPPHAMAQGGGAPIDIWIGDVSPTSNDVVVTSSMNGTGHFSAVVHVNMTGNETAIVFLTANTSAGWPAMVAPSAVPFTSSGSTHVSITVIIPAATKVQKADLTITAECLYSNSTYSAHAYASISVAQYFRLNLSSRIVKMVGTENIVEVTVTNTGNGVDSYSITIPDAEKFDKKGVIITASTLELYNVSPGGSATVRFNLKYIGNNFTFVDSIPVIFTSNGAKESGYRVAKTEPLMVMFKKLIGNMPAYEVGVALTVTIIMMIVVVLIILRKETR